MKLRMMTAVTILAVTTGCATSAYKVHPGAGGYVAGTIPTAAQQLDSREYDALVAADGVIATTRAEYQAGKFPAASMPTLRNTINALVIAYDTANGQWMAFDAALKAGGTPSQDAVVSAIAAMQSALTALANAKGGN